MRNYFRLMLGPRSIHAKECRAGNFIGTDFDIHQDLTGQLPDEWRTFNRTFLPVYLEARPDKTKIGAGLACGMLWTVSKGIQGGDIVLCPDGSGRYNIAEVTGDYYYAPGEILPHRRPVRWLDQIIDRADMSEELKRSAGSVGTLSDLSRPAYRDEIERLMGGSTPREYEEPIEDLAAFTMEAHLEEFLVRNWSQTELGREYDIYQEEGETVGRQYQTDTGPLDILAISKDRKTLLVVELKKGRASDAVVGQILRYMSYVDDQLAEEGQAVRGIVIALEDDQRIRRALAMVPIIEFYRYQISFKLVKV